MLSALLPALAVVVGALLALGPVAWAAGPRLAARGMLGLCALGTLVSLAALLAGPPPAPLELPIGLPGSGILFALDGLSALFLVLLFVAGTAVAAAALEGAAGRAAPFLPVLAGAGAATLLAADGFSVVLGFEAAALAAAALATPMRALGGDGPRRPAIAGLGGGVAAGLALVAAMAALAPLQPWGLDLSFAGMRAHPPQGAAAVAALLLTLLAAGAAAGLAPLHRFLPAASAAASGPAGALLVAALPLLGLYLLVRLLFDLAGPAQPGWWGVLPVLAGGAGAMLGAAQAARATDLRRIPGAAAVAQAGLAAVALGLALAARASDLAPLAPFALAAALLLVVAQTLGGTLLALAAGIAEAGAGARRLDRLGGLLRGMPVTTLCALGAAASLAALPPGPGFAAAWMLLQALIGAARTGGLGWQALVTLAAMASVVAVSLCAVAAVRLAGIGFLGRPRTPRGAAAREAGLPARAAMLALAGLALLAGLLPGPLLRLAEPALHRLLSFGMADRAGILVLAPLPDAPGLAPLLLGLVLLLAAGAAFWLMRLRAAIGHRAGPAWEGGGPPPPPWLPFGDPVAQIGPEGFAAPLDDLLAAALPRLRWKLRGPLRVGRRVLARAEGALHPSPRMAAALLLAVAVLLLLAAVLAEQT